VTARIHNCLADHDTYAHTSLRWLVATCACFQGRILCRVDHARKLPYLRYAAASQKAQPNPLQLACKHAAVQHDVLMARVPLSDSAGVVECLTRCAKYNGGPGAQCDSVTMLARPRRKRERRGPNCFYRTETVPDMCAQDNRFDTYTRTK